MALTTDEKLLIEQRVANDGKSTGVAYLLWLFLGGLGGHRFYLGKTGTGLLMLALLGVGVLTSAIGIGFVFLIAVGIWALVDAFLIPGMIRADKDAIRARLSAEA